MIPQKNEKKKKKTHGEQQRLWDTSSKTA